MLLALEGVDVGGHLRRANHLVKVLGVPTRELRSVGINLPLGVVSDLAYNLFAVRGIDRDSAIGFIFSY